MTKPISSDKPEQTPFERFTDAARKVFNTPKSELAKPTKGEKTAKTKGKNKRS